MKNSLSILIFLVASSFLITNVTSFLGLPILTCHITCLTCSGPNANQCTTCLAGLLPLGGSCSCADGKYYSGALSPCANCNPSCATCDGPATTDCLSCPTNYNFYSGSCYAPCTTTTQYFDTNALACANCHTNCLTCTGSGSNQCKSCQTATLTSGTCICPLGQYTVALGGCAPCHVTCKGCSGSAVNQCTSCNAGMVLQSGKCLCTTGTYLVTGPTVSCPACHNTCLGCSGPLATDCTSCRSGFELSGGQCICLPGTFYDPGTLSCSPCYTRCSSCTGSANNQCTGCKNNLDLVSGQCNCPSGTYLDSGLMACRPCHSSCQECSGSTETECTSCLGSLMLDTSGKCVCGGGTCSCPSGFYADTATNTCQPCNPTCKECSGPNSLECTDCRSDYSLDTAINPYQCKCTAPPSCSCPTKTYFETSSSTCESCHSTCATCTGPNDNQCQSCITGLDYSPNTCTCPAGSYLHPSLLCFPCHSTCDTCSGSSSTQCILCKSGLSKVGSECKCPTRKYFDTSALTCGNCNVNCLTCSGPEINQCLSCDSGKTLDSTGLCLTNCNSKQYRDTLTDHSCQPCDSTCLTCDGGSPNDCLSCLAPRTLTGRTCPAVIISTGCHYTCTTCLPGLSGSSSECLTCPTSKVLMEVATSYGFCIDSCPTGYYIVTENSQAKCRQKTKLNNRLAYGPESNQIELTFEKDIRPFLQLLIDSIEVAIEFRSDQPPIEFKYSLTLTGSATSLMLNMTFYGHLLPRNTLRIKYVLPTVDSPDDNSPIYVVNKLHTLRLMEYYENGGEVSNVVAALTQVNSVGTIANTVFSWTSSMALRSVHALRSEIVEDMIGYFIFMNIDYTPNFIHFAQAGLNSFELIMPNLFAPLMDADTDSPDDLDSTRILENSNDTFIQREIVSRSNHAGKYSRMLLSTETEILFNMRLDDREFLVNHGAATSLLLIAFGVIIVVDGIKYLVDKTTTKKGRLQRYIRAASCSFRWNFIVGHFSSEYQGFVFFSIIQLVNESKPTEDKDFVTFIFGMMSFLISTLAVIAAFLVSRRANMKLKALEKAKGNENEKEKIDTDLKRIGLFFESFKEESYVQLLYPGLLVTRCFGFGIVLVFLTDYPYVQIIYLLVSTAGIISYLAYIKPLKKKTQNTLTIVYEFCFLAISALTLVLHVYNGINIQDVEARSWICLVMLSIGTAMIILNMISLALEILEFRNLFFKKKAKVTPLNNTKAVETKPVLKITTTGTLRTHSAVSIPNIGSDTEDQPIKGLRKDLKALYSPTNKPKLNKEYSDDEYSTIQEKKETLADLLSKKKPEAPSTLNRLTEDYPGKRYSTNIIEPDSSEKIPLKQLRARGSQILNSISPKAQQNGKKRFDFGFQKLDTSQTSSINMIPSKQGTTEFNMDSQNFDNRPKQSLMSRHQVPTLAFDDLGKNAQSNKFLTTFDLEGVDSVPSKRTIPDRRNVSRMNNSFQNLKPPEKSQDEMKANSLVLQDQDMSRVEALHPPRSADRNKLKTPNDSILQDTIVVPRKMIQVKYV